VTTASDLERIQHIRKARGKFIAMAVSYALGIFNDNYFRTACMLMAVAMADTLKDVVPTAKELPLVEGFQANALFLFPLPYLLFAAPAGWLADRLPKRYVVIATKLLELLAMVIGAVAILSGNWYLMLAVIFLMGLQSCLFNPALNGSIPELYPADYVMTANAKLKIATTGAILVGVMFASVALNYGKIYVVVGALCMAAVGVVAAFGVPRRQAAAPDTPFPWSGPYHTILDLGRIGRDRILSVAVGTDAVFWFLGALLLAVVNVLGLQHYFKGDENDVLKTGMLSLVELIGVAGGGVLGARWAQGKHWCRVLTPAAFGMALAMGGVWLLPDLGLGAAEIPTLLVLLGLTGLFAGLIMIPCGSFIQVRPKPERKGAVISAANFATMGGVLLAGPALLLLTGAKYLEFDPFECFAVASGVAALAGIGLLFAIPSGPGNLIEGGLAWFVRRLLRLRYRVTIKGLREIRERGTDGIIFLPNHPALIDPILMVSTLFDPFAPRAWAAADRVNIPVIGHLFKRFGVRAVPSITREGRGSRNAVRAALEATAQDLTDGNCVLLYPSGHIYREHFEDLRGNSAVAEVLRLAPDARVVLVRTSGLWGSRFSWGGCPTPGVGAALKRGLPGLLLSGLFFAPRRRVTLEFHEPDDLPRDAGRDVINRKMEAYFNEHAPPNTYVPYSIWEGGGTRQVPEPFRAGAASLAGDVPAATRKLVVDELRSASGIARVSDEQNLAADLGLDSLARAELITWLETEFGFDAGNTDSIQTVADLLLAACGEAAVAEPEAAGKVPAAWFRNDSVPGAELPPIEGDSIPAAFLHIARRTPGRVLLADRMAGVRTCRDVLTGVCALLPDVRALDGEHIGIMLPAGVTATILTLTVQWAGKVPVMVNWTVGPRNMRHCLDLVGVRHVITAQALLDRIAKQGTDLGDLAERFVCLEDIARGMSRGRKLGAAVRARFMPGSLARLPVNKTATILFTSGSENLPKAVPLTHHNVIVNLRDSCRRLRMTCDDHLIGMLPPFHSFGLTCGMALPLCTGLRTVYHANPTQAGTLSRIISDYKVTLLFSTPTFLGNILRVSDTARLSSLRIAVTGAEKCPDRVYDKLEEMCPHAAVLEGYGVTECSPVVSVNMPDDPQRGTIGRVLRSVDYAVVDVDTGQRVAPGTQGMLLVTGPSIFGGYLGYDGPSPFVTFEDRQWYRTGDLVTEDADGVLTFRGRLKRFIKLGGEMISLPAIESVLTGQYPAGEEGPIVAIEATPTEDRPEVVLFAVGDIDRQTANQHIIDAGLSSLHKIRRVVQVDAIPQLGTGKTDYRSLKGMLGED